MAQNKLPSHPVPAAAETGFGRMVIGSLVLHALVVALFSGLLIPVARKNDRPVYYVDLVNLPVERPQAGRPDGRKTEKITAKKPEAKVKEKEKAVPKKVTETVKVAPKKTETVKVAPAKKTTVKPKTKEIKAAKPKKAPEKKQPPKEKPKTIEKDYQSVLSAVEVLRAKKEKAAKQAAKKDRIEALKNKLAALTTQDSRLTGTGSDAPLGMSDGTGDQAGVSFGLWLQSYLTSNWSLSKYQLSRQDLEAEIFVVYDAEGILIRKKLTRSSGDAYFDRSVEDAVEKSDKLPQAPKKRLEFNIVFNLKDLLEKN
jgi:colicin import membrane protein